MAAKEAPADSMWLGILALTFLFVVFGGMAFAVLRMTGQEEEEPEQKGQKVQKKRGALDRMQRGAANAAGEEDDGEEEEDEGENAGGGDAETRARNEKKEAKRQERQMAADQQRQLNRDRNQANTEKQAKYNQKQQQKDAEFQKKDDAEQKARDDKEKAEQEEFEKWKAMFEVEAVGEDDGDAPDVGAVERFVDYIKVRKVVNLEDLAADFRMKTQTAVDRLKELERVGRISGIFDDRGKFVYITADEMAAVAEFLKNKGRISRADLVAACNKLVRLNPTDKDKARLQKEASSALDALDKGVPEIES